MKVTELLHQWNNGEQDAFGQVVESVHGELSGRAHQMMKSESPQHTLQAEGLVNEAYLRLQQMHDVDWQNRHHFYAIAAQVMRRVLVDDARARNALKRGGDVVHVTFDEDCMPLKNAGDRNVDYVALDDALSRLEANDSVQAKIVELRFFAGLSVADIAAHLNTSVSTVKRKWKLSQSWLHRELYAD